MNKQLFNFQVGSAKAGQICFGDSGGPLMMKKGTVLCYIF